MRRKYPVMKPAAKILFVDDYPAGNGYDAMFVLRLLYHDPRIEVFRLKGAAELQPDREHPPNFDHVFTTGADTYVELTAATWRSPSGLISCKIMRQDGLSIASAPIALAMWFQA